MECNIQTTSCSLPRFTFNQSSYVMGNTVLKVLVKLSFVREKDVTPLPRKKIIPIQEFIF